jgi:N-acetylgalactosamine-6-sulfatase
MIESMDENIGRILRALETHNLVDNTVVIFASDNGASRSGSNAPFSGFKGSTYEGGIRVPAMVRWPGVIPENTVSDQINMTFDLTTSIAAIAGVKPDTEKPFDGFDIIAHVVQNKPDSDRTLFWRKPRGTTIWKAARQGHFKYINYTRGDEQEEMFFDLSSDPHEENNIRTRYPKQFEQLKHKYLEWEQEVRMNRRGAVALGEYVD